MRVAVVGGGVIGLACAWELARAGAEVALFDAAPEAREASWAAAGMLAPHHEYDADVPLWRLAVASLERYPAFLAALGAEPAAVDFRRAGGLLPALDDDGLAALSAKRAFLAAAGIPCVALAGAALRAREPQLSPAVVEALEIPAGQIDPRRLTAVLRERCAALGVGLGYRRAIAAIEDDGVRLADGDHVRCDHVVLASGAWTPALAAACGIDLPGEPVKGQLLRFQVADGLLGRFVHHHLAYLVPRAGGGVVVGATMVRAGFDRADDPGAVAALAAGARRLLPALAEAPIVETWTGLRPRLQHGLPVIATVRGRLTIATGHYRNGILLAPISAAAVAALVLGRTPPVDLAPFGPPCPTSSSSKTTPSTAS
jgi:glycine oxidase